MANLKIDKILIKRFKSGIKENVLEAGEFGYDALNKKLYLGNGTDNTEIAIDADLQAHIENGDVHITDAERTKLEGIAAGAQVNVIEAIKLNGAVLPVDENKTVNLGSIATSEALEAINNKLPDGTIADLDDITSAINDLGDLASKDKVAETDLDTALAGKVGNGATAYSWGDHSQQGYLKSGDITGKADKVAGATAGNFAGLDANGNLVDSNSKASDFAVAGHNHDDDYSKLDHNHNAAYAGKGYETKVDTLIGSDADSSVRTIAADEVAKVVASAPADFDTLKEVADWIASDTTESAKLQTSVAALIKEIGGTETPDGYTNSRLDTVEGWGDHAQAGYLKAADITGKVDKVSGVAGNIVEFGANGAIADSGKKVEDFAETGHKHVAADINDFADSVKAVKVNNAANADSADVADKVANKLTFGSKTFDGSAAQTITAADLGALTAHQDISGKADKVENATNGNFAGLDANGNLVDSGKNANSFATADHNHDNDYDAKGAAGTAESNAKGYTDTEVAKLDTRIDTIEAAHTGNGSISNNVAQPSVLNKLNVTNGHVVSGEFVTLESLLNQLTFTIDAGEVE